MARLFGLFNINIYFCIRLRKVRAFSSAGLEHLPYCKSAASSFGGSNPSLPTRLRDLNCGSNLFFFMAFSLLEFLDIATYLNVK